MVFNLFLGGGIRVWGVDPMCSDGHSNPCVLGSKVVNLAAMIILQIGGAHLLGWGCPLNALLLGCCPCWPLLSCSVDKAISFCLVESIF